MKKTTLLLAAVCAAATGLFSFSPAMAAAPGGFAGNVGFNYNDITSGASGNAWGINGAGAFGFGASDLAAQINGSYDSLSPSGGGGSPSDWTIGGSVFWAPSTVRLGATVGYDSLSVGSGGSANANVTNYGAFAEWFASDGLTVGVKGGGFSASGNASGFGFSGSGSTNGYYWGGELTGYLWSDFALQATVDGIVVTGSTSVTDISWTIGGEWLVSDSMPFSVAAGYRGTTITSAPAFSQFFLRLNYYFDSDGSMSLRDRQRNGAVGWAAAPERVIPF